MTKIKTLTTVAALCVAPAIAQAEGWSYGSDVCKAEKEDCMTNFVQAMSVDFYLGAGQLTLKELQVLSENFELTDDMMIPARTWIRIS
ncbi:MAG: hypothetical protein AAF092_17190 [Pseudomonadota bacterium]